MAITSFFSEVIWPCFGNSCYHFPSPYIPASKAAADNACQALGAHVVATETQEEWDYFDYMIKSVPGRIKYMYVSILNELTFTIQEFVLF